MNFYYVKGETTLNFTFTPLKLVKFASARTRILRDSINPPPLAQAKQAQELIEVQNLVRVCPLGDSPELQKNAQLFIGNKVKILALVWPETLTREIASAQKFISIGGSYLLFIYLQCKSEFNAEYKGLR